MKKKIMAVTLCLAMASTFVVGCGQKKETDSGKSEEKSSGKVEIEFVQVKREAAESYTKVIEAFEKENPDIVIKQNVVPDAQEVLMTRASSDNLPDLMNHWPTDAQFVQFEDEGLDDARLSNTGGAGLGLSIAEEIIHLHGGTITASSQNETIDFVITLPISA